LPGNSKETKKSRFPQGSVKGASPKGEKNEGKERARSRISGTTDQEFGLNPTGEKHKKNSRGTKMRASLGSGKWVFKALETRLKGGMGGGKE